MKEGLNAVGQAATVGATVIVLQRVKPVEMIPVAFVKNNAWAVETALGVVGLIVLHNKNPYIKAVAVGTLASGLMKTVDKFVFKAK